MGHHIVCIFSGISTKKTGKHMKWRWRNSEITGCTSMKLGDIIVEIYGHDEGLTTKAGKDLRPRNSCHWSPWMSVGFSPLPTVSSKCVSSKSIFWQLSGRWLSRLKYMLVIKHHHLMFMNET